MMHRGGRRGGEDGEADGEGEEIEKYLTACVETFSCFVFFCHWKILENVTRGLIPSPSTFLNIKPSTEAMSSFIPCLITESVRCRAAASV